MQWIVKRKGEFQLNIEELYLVKEFRELIESDVANSVKHMAMLWYTHSPDSIGVKEGITGDDLHKAALKNADLPEDWVPSAEYTAANRLINKFDGIASKSYKSMIKSLATARMVVDKLNEGLTRELMMPNVSTIRVNEISATTNQLLIITKSIATNIIELKKAEESARNEQETLGYSRGGGQISKSMIPPE